MAKRPAGFVLFTDDALSSSRIAMMTDEEFRAYMLLLWHCWNLSCSLPGPLPQALHEWERLAGRSVSKNVQSCFIPHPDKPGYLTHTKLYRQLLKREQARLAGEKSAANRWGNETGNGKDSESDSVCGNETDATSKPPSYPIKTPLPPRGKACDCDAIDWNDQINKWNGEVAVALHAPMVHGLNPTRRKKLAARLADLPDLWDRVLEEAHLLNQFAREKGFIKFDWLMSPGNLTKFLEGNYRTKDQINVRPPKPTDEEATAAYVPPHGSPRGWNRKEAPANRGIDLDSREREDCKN